jgi:hypothetical protein
MAGKAFISVSKPVVTVNAKELLRELTVDGKNSRSMALAIRNEIKPRLEERQKELLKSFDAHPITVELNAGPRAANISGALGGYGNLFSFIGFNASDRPTALISAIFKEKMQFKVRRVSSSGKYKISFFIPSIEQIYSLTPIPWMSGKSWVKGIEEGSLSNLGQYLYSSSGFNSSRAGTGIQAKNKSSGVSLKRMPYISKLIEKFKSDLLKLDK